MWAEGGNHDRLLVALFAACVFHAVLILGVGFELPKPKAAQKSLDIILVDSPSDEAPDEADFLAPVQQKGAGEGRRKAVPSAAPIPKPGQGEEEQEPAPQQKPESAVGPKPMLTQARSEKKVLADVGDDEPAAAEQERLAAGTPDEEAIVVADEPNFSLEDEAKGRRVVHISAVNARRYKAAAYEAAWQKKIERVGNLHYPDEARRRKLSGSLTLDVGVRPDGSIDNIKLRESSGEPVLDEAALRIVRQAAPFPAFPPELRQVADVLVITRTWCFSVKNRVETCR